MRRCTGAYEGCFVGHVQQCVTCFLYAQVQKLATAAGAMKCTMLAVSGAFHTPLMQPAREALVQVQRPSNKIRW